MECWLWVLPPSGDSPKAVAIASTIVDLPEPFSPTRKVTPGPRSSPSASTCATAGIEAGYDLGAELVPGARLDPAYGVARDVVTPQRHGDNLARPTSPDR